MILISVHDIKAETWSPPVCMPTKASAVRDFANACAKSGTVMAQCPQDFELWQVGEWHDNGVDAAPHLHAFEQFVCLDHGADYVSK